jgi:hypothetical protein
MVGRKLGLTGEALENAKRRLIEVGLIDDDWQPVKWSDLQFVSDQDPTRNERQKRYREKQRNALRNASNNAQITPLDTDTDTDKEKVTTDVVTKKKNFGPTNMPELNTQTAADLIAHRKAKGAPMSATVWSKALGEFEKAGLSPEEGAQEWIARGWQGFKAQWLENEKTRTAGQHGSGSTGNTNQRGNYEPQIDPITRRLRELKRASSGNTPLDAIEGNFSIDLAATWDAARGNRGGRN